MKRLSENKKFLSQDPFHPNSAFWLPVVYKRKLRGKYGGRFLVKCGDRCGESVEIHFCPNPKLTMVEINGVAASIEVWRKLLGEIFEEIEAIT